MLVELRLLGEMKRRNPLPGMEGGRAGLSVPEGTRLSEFLGDKGLDPDKTLVVLVNGRRPGGDPELKEGDAVSVFPPVAGG